MTLAVAILAGGLATRLRPLTEAIPKSLVEVAGEPFVVHQLELLRRARIERVALCIGYLGGMVRDVVGDGSRWGLRVSYSEDGPRLLGTGGALRQALPLLGDAFFVLYGDSYLRTDYAAVESAFRASGKKGLMTVLGNENRWDRSNVVFEGGQILRYDKKDADSRMRHIDYGLGALQASVFERYGNGNGSRNGNGSGNGTGSEGPLDLAAVYRDLVAEDELAGFEVAERFYEIGSPEGLEETRALLSETTRGRE